MSDLLWPGAERSAAVFDDRALVRAMLHVEWAWLDSLVDAGIAPATAALDDLLAFVSDADVERLAAQGEVIGNAVGPLVDLLRERLADTRPDAARWLHRGLTSQDVLDTALMLCAASTMSVVGDALRRQVVRLRSLAEAHRDTPMTGRTLTQPAVPVTFGWKVSNWLAGVLEAAEELARLDPLPPAQFGGAVGTRAALVELGRARGLADPVAVAQTVTARTAMGLYLRRVRPWPTNRAPVLRLGSTFAAAVAADGHIAADVLVLGRPEIGELRTGVGGSTTMPHKANPVLAVLVRRAAIAAPADLATLYSAAGLAVDERPDGAWHVEGPALQRLARVTVTAAAQTADLLDDLEVDIERMRANLARADGMYAERDAMRALVGAGPDDEPDDEPDDDAYLGATGALVDEVLERARRYEQDNPPR